MSAAETLDLDDEPGPSLEFCTRQIERLSRDLDAQQRELDEAARSLEEAHRLQAVLERDKSLAEARVEAIEEQLIQAREERNLLTSRLANLVSERDLALGAMGWWSKKRYARRTKAKKLHPSGV